MRKYVLSLLLLSIVATVFGQKKSIVNLIKSKSSTGIKLNGKDLIKVYDGTFRQDFSTLTSDSAYFYPQDNAFDAFGHVNINQGDTLNIYADKLNYNGNTKIAILTNNVRMVDKDATLTTNHLTYNTATRIGTYTDGGKLVNKDNTLLSKNGYYFAYSRDSYFRYNVSLKTPDALVKTDTMKYNTGSKIAYFYGPTNIYSTKDEKDKDTLYTENGTYNTTTEQANFGKKNLYRSGTKSLKGDSLFYDKIKGYGRAVNHVTFTDKEQKTTIKGNLGTYFKADERAVVTQDPYVIMVTEEKDSTKTDSVAKADSLLKKRPVKNKGTINMAQVIKNTIPANILPAKIDTAAGTQKKLKAKADSVLKTLSPTTQRDMAVKADSIIKTLPAAQKGLGTKADSLLKTFQVSTKSAKRAAASTKKAGAPAKTKTTGKPADKTKGTDKMAVVKDTSTMKHDSIYMSADTIETQILTYKDLKLYQEKQRLAHIRDTTSKPKPKIKVKEKPSKFLTATFIGVTINDTSYRRPDFFGKPKPVIVKKKPVKPLSKQQLALDSLKQKKTADSILTAKKLEPSDTARIRILIAHHHAKIFKSDLQAKADSMFYSGSDSTIRCFVKPIIWTQGSQLSGDTVYLQMKHKKLDNLTMFLSAFIVNIDKDDSVHFNQVGGKRMWGYFKDDKLNRMIIAGNSESIYFSRDSAKNEVDGMQRSISSRITADFKDNKVTNLGFYTKPQNVYSPIAKVKDDDKILKGFTWKPKERPVSKESIIPSYNKKAVSAKGGAGKSKTGKAALKKLPDGKMVKDSAGKAPVVMPGLNVGKDSTQTVPATQPGLKTIKDSIKNIDPGKPFAKPVKDTATRIKKDTVNAKPAVKKPADKANE